MEEGRRRMMERVVDERAGRRWSGDVKRGREQGGVSVKGLEERKVGERSVTEPRSASEETLIRQEEKKKKLKI